MDELHPLLLMTKTELRLAKKLIKQSDDDDKREQASNRLAELSEVVLGREIGLKKYMVIRVEREDGFTLQLQVLSFLISYFRGEIFARTERSVCAMRGWLSGMRVFRAEC